MIGNEEIDKFNELYNLGRYSEAYDYICQRKLLVLDDDLESIYTIIALLVDVADVGKIEHAALEAYELMNKFGERFLESFDRSSIEYNWGNAAKTLFDIYRAKDPSLLKPEFCGLLVEAKNHYWRAYKEKPEDIELVNRITTNLGIVLSVCGRVSESFIYYEEVLSKAPRFGQALIARGRDLDWLRRLSGGVTVQQVLSMRNDFEKALECDDTLPQAKGFALEQINRCNSFLKNESFDLDLDNEIELTKKESEGHTEERKFHLVNNLALSEHSLYCRCVGAERDNLSIPVEYAAICGKFVGRQEQILNRLKCEFSFARNLFYLAKVKQSDFFESQNYNMCLSELFEGEVSGARAENLRVAFKNCFGILDKIAEGVCDLYNFEVHSRERIYFHNFWKGSTDRWNEINLIDNYSLFSLFHQAQDLNSKTGEWSFYRDWRNALEHSSFVLVCSEEIFNPLGVYDSKFEVLRVEYDYFENQVLKMLQFTRSAIFSYAFCVRGEASKKPEDDLDEDSRSIRIDLLKKEFFD